MIKVYTIPEFDRSLVRLSKKYRSLKAELLQKRIADYSSKL